MGEVKMTVNVSLCGCVPRSQMTRRCIHPRNILETDASLPFQSNPTECRSDYTAPFTSSLTRKPRTVSNECLSTLPSQISPPTWAVPARGEAKLEPVDGAAYGLAPVDLTTNSCFRFGRSQNSDIQLLHETSSRRHAIIFHHPNGSCYVVDCGSAHGTYVNGIKVNTPVAQENMQTGAVIPHRVKKGSLIRFGGIGAPTYSLKSFSVPLSDLVNHLEISKSFCGRSNVIEDESKPSSSCSFGRYEPSEHIVNDSLVALNTRLNAMGRTSMKYALRRCLPALAKARLYPQPGHSLALPTLKKRPFTSLIPRTVSTEDHLPKKRRAVSLESDDGVRPSFGHMADAALVSPSRTSTHFTLDFNDGDRPIVSPNPSIEIDNLDFDTAGKSILFVPLSLSLTRKLKKKVKFNIPACETSHMKKT